MKNYSEELYKQITVFLDDDGWNYDFEEEIGVVFTEIQLGNVLKRARIFIDIRDDKYLVYAAMDPKCAEAFRFETASLLTRINYDIVYGSFDMDFSDGDIRFRFPVDCDGMLPSRDIVQDSIALPALMMERFGEAICRVMNGVCSAETAHADERFARIDGQELL